MRPAAAGAGSAGSGPGSATGGPLREPGVLRELRHLLATEQRKHEQDLALFAWLVHDARIAGSLQRAQERREEPQFTSPPPAARPARGSPRGRAKRGKHASAKTGFARNGTSSRRAQGFWDPFNAWWRARHDALGRRPSRDEVAEWWDANAALRATATQAETWKHAGSLMSEPRSSHKPKPKVDPAASRPRLQDITNSPRAKVIGRRARRPPPSRSP